MSIKKQVRQGKLRINTYSYELNPIGSVKESNIEIIGEYPSLVAISGTISKIR